MLDQAFRWAYSVVQNLLPLSSADAADSEPSPHESPLPAVAFRPNPPRAAHLKCKCYLRNVLPYACPLTHASIGSKLIILVTGESFAGKDYTAGLWVSYFSVKGIRAGMVSISDAIKAEYAEATGADLSRLLGDRAYKEQHRPALTAFYQDRVRQRPQLPEEQFLKVVHGAGDVELLFVTGMTDEAPVATFSPLVPDSRLLEVRVQVDEETLQARRKYERVADGDAGSSDKRATNTRASRPSSLKHRLCLIFQNDTVGDKAAIEFAVQHLHPFFDAKLQRLADMVRSIPDFPRSGIDFRHVLNVAQQPGGLTLCTSLLQDHFTKDWNKVDMMVSCETGGFIFASALAAHIGIPLALVRQGVKLPPPVLSIEKSTSHISSYSSSSESIQRRFELGRGVISRGASVVVVDDVLATGKSLLAVLHLVTEAGVSPEDVSVMVVAEFPIHRGRQLLLQEGFGRVSVQSLLIYGGE
ncbi:uncharacterized protein E0L32_010016 [Thyridium curvatum]|uniref:adenine phosphoribosyltransferase n=1 Tax=Thyridium curvatum TaxID=1093900 RepID=A0A507AUD2_9PEZI|nr:uncharacterized protein E0L32_010016 [Thyridium curvatum]TPX08529.1 hypothetical protein E0L32_010016 [Thyridium curvatum]